MKILMCHDGLSETDKSLRFAVLIAKAFGAEVTLLGITETGGADAAVLLAHLQRTREFLEKEGIKTELVSKSGTAVSEIASHGEKENYDLIVLGAGQPGTRMPETTYQLVRKMEPPALLVMGERTTLKKILVCSGGRAHIEHALHEAAEIAQHTGAAITLLHVLAEAPIVYAGLMEREEDAEALLASSSELGRNLRRQRDMLAAGGASVEVRVTHGDVVDQIMGEAARIDCDLIVVGSPHDSTPFYRYMLGDVAREIVTQSSCPVLIARPPRGAGSPRGGFLSRFFGKLKSQKPGGDT